MHTVYGIWERWAQLCGGISKSVALAADGLLTILFSSFLIKDAQQDIAGARLKA